MSNPLYQMMKQDGGQNGLVARFNEFKRNFNGDPQQQVQNLLNSGRITQQQYDAAVQKAKALARMLGM